jgi:hypothetical protein
VVAAQAGRRRGSAWLLGLRRTKASRAQRSGREGGRWVGELGGGRGGFGRPAGQGRRSGRAGWAGKEKKKEIHSILISRFRKMNKEIRVTEIIGKIPKFLENCRKYGKARM